MKSGDAAAAAALDRAWKDPPTLAGWIFTVDHKAIGRRFIVTALGFFAAAGILGGLVRHQLAVPDNTLLGPDLYNQVFTMHGTTMMFLFAVPVMQGFAVYLVPLMIGTRNTAFPRMTACAYWLYLIGGLMLFVAFAFNTGADAGWFAYVPLAGPEYGIGKRADFWNNVVNFTEATGLMVAVDIATVILKLRAPGMSLRLMPLFAWSSLVTAIMIIFAMPTVMLGANLVQMDRMVGTHFFNPAEGGDVLLWQHLFWYFGHPEVYFIFIPALGFISAIIPTFARRPMFGHDAIVLSLIATGFLSFGLWVHHMFATNVPELGKSFFTAMSMMIAIPSAVQIFCWIATLWNGRLNVKAPLLFVLGFFFVLMIGGLTGIILGSVPLDLQVHDTYFVVGHLHYVLIGGAVFPLFAAVYYWFPKVYGRVLSERLARWQFALLFVGFNLTFFPMHQLGLSGMPSAPDNGRFTIVRNGPFMPINRALLRVVTTALALVATSARPADVGAPPFSDTLEQRLVACAACHGKQGEGIRQNEYYPRIAGKPVRYLYRQLVNFREGRRSYPQMVYFTRYLSDEYLLEIATYYSQLKPPFPTPIQPSATREALARGEALVLRGDPAKGVPACAECHGKALTGMQPGIPGLIGLYPDYINAQMNAWKSRIRHATEPDCMAKIAGKLSGVDIASAAAYLASQPGTPATVPQPESRQKLPLACGSQGS